MKIELVGTPGGKLDGANVELGNGIVLELATLREDEPYGWGFWAVRINGVWHGRVANLDPEPLADSPLRRLVEQECEAAIRASRKEVDA